MSDYQPVQLFIEKLATLEAGERARLKRCAGQTLAESRENALFYRLLPKGVPEYREEIYFLVATLYPMAENTTDGDFGDSLRNARDEKNHTGIDRRVQALLDADESQLSFRLRQAVHYLYSRPERGKVNWQKLLEDLHGWDSQEHYVQRRWARNYFAK